MATFTQRRYFYTHYHKYLCICLLDKKLGLFVIIATHLKLFPLYPALCSIFVHLHVNGMQKFNWPIYYYLNELVFKNGISITLNGRIVNVPGSLLFFLADTLAAHQLGSFKVGVGFLSENVETALLLLNKWIKMYNKYFACMAVQVHTW